MKKATELAVQFSAHETTEQQVRAAMIAISRTVEGELADSLALAIEAGPLRDVRGNLQDALASAVGVATAINRALLLSGVLPVHQSLFDELEEARADAAMYANRCDELDAEEGVQA